MPNAIHQNGSPRIRMWSEQLLQRTAWQPQAAMPAVTAMSADENVSMLAASDHHRYPEPVDEPPPDVEPIPPELPQPQPSPIDPTPGQAPMKAGSVRQSLLMRASACPLKLNHAGLTQALH